MPLDRVPLADAIMQLGKKLQVSVELPRAVVDPDDPDAEPYVHMLLQQSVSCPDVELAAHQMLELLLFQIASHFGASVRDGRLVIREESTFLHRSQLHVVPADLQKAAGIRSDSLLDLITHVISSNASGTASCYELPGSLIVQQSPLVQRRIQGLIEALTQSHRDPDRVAPIWVGPPDAFASPAIQQRLEQPIYLRGEMSLIELVRRLNEDMDLPVVLDHAGLSGATIAPDAKMLIDWNGLPAGIAIDHLLRGSYMRLASHDGVLVITSSELANHYYDTVVYPVSDLQQAGVDLWDQLTSSVVDFDSNDADFGEDEGETCGTSLVVTHSPEAHANLARFLGDLRAILNKPKRDHSSTGNAVATEVTSSMDQLVTWHIEDEPLGEVLPQLLSLCQLQMVVDERALKEADFAEEWTTRRVSCSVEQEPLWSALDKLCAPHLLAVIPIGDAVVELTSAEKHGGHYRRVRLYDVAPLLGAEPHSDQTDAFAELFEQILDLHRSSGGSLSMIKHVMIVAEEESQQRVVRPLIEDLMQVPDAREGVVLVGQLQDEFEVYSNVETSSDSFVPYVTRVYALPRMWSQESVCPVSGEVKGMLEQLTNQVASETWYGSDSERKRHGFIMPWQVEGRWCLVVKQVPAVHQEVKQFLDAKWALQREAMTTQRPSSDWRMVELPPDTKNSAAKMLVKNCEPEWLALSSLLPEERRRGFNVHLRPVDAANKYQTHLQHSLAINGEKRPVYVWGSHLGFRAEEESADHEFQQAIDRVREQLASMAQEVGPLTNDVSVDSIDRLVAIFFEDADIGRRYSAAFWLEFLIHSRRTLSDQSFATLVAREKQMTDRDDRATIKQLAESIRYGSDAATHMVIDAVPQMSTDLQESVIYEVSRRGPAAVPELCRLLRVRLRKDVRERLAGRLTVAARGDEQSIRQVIEAAIDAPEDVQMMMSLRMSTLDPRTKSVRKLMSEFSQRDDPEFQRKWGPFRTMISSYVGDE